MKTFIKDKVALLAAKLMRHLAPEPRYFELWQRHDFHVLPIHFYSPVPDTAELSPAIFDKETSLDSIAMNEERQVELLNVVKSTFGSEYEQFVARTLDYDQPRFAFGNSSFESVDAEMLYSMIRLHKPRRIIEIGSGFTTLIASEALAMNEKEGKEAIFTAIEPYPPAFLRKPLPCAVDLRSTKVQDVPLSVFQELVAGDILFIDSSHVVKVGSDSHFEFSAILPALRPGVVVHLHDIFIPKEYPKHWILSEHRFWNEQYMLHAFLSGNRDYEILWAGAFMHYRHPQKLRDAFSSYDPAKNLPASFWMRRCDPSAR